VVGRAAGNASAAPEALMRDYEVVFAKGRTVLEALAVGCAVVLADSAGAGPLVTRDNYKRLRARNFGIRELAHAHDVAWYGSQIAEYCPGAAADVSARVRAEAGLEPAVDRLIEIYAAAMTSPPGPGEPSRAAAVHCSRIARPLKEAHTAELRIRRLTSELESAHARIDACAGEEIEFRQQLASAHDSQQQLASAHQELLHALESRIAELGAAREELQGLRSQVTELAAARAELQAVRTEVATFRALPTLRLRDALLKAPVVGPVLQASARRLAKLL